MATDESVPPRPEGADARELERVKAAVRRRLIPTSEMQSPKIGRFSVLGRLGHGGMGVVYAVYDEELDRRVALKLIKGDARPELRARLQREARAMAKLSHPNVVPVFEVGEHEGELFIVMEYVKGRSLRTWVAEGNLESDEIIRAYVQAGYGLAAAHATGLVHRDFKPDNAIVDETDRVRVLDFGLARKDTEGIADAASRDADLPTLADDAFDTPLTATGSLMGTPAYMAPEQFLGEATDHRADQFSFCVSLWEALCGERPFSGQTKIEVFKNIEQGKISSPPRNSRMPGWIRPLLERGLQASPDDRWPSMDALLAGITGHGRARARRRFLGSGVALALVTGGLFGWNWLDHAQEMDACAEEAATLDDFWNDDAQARIRAAFSGTNVHHAQDTYERLVPWLDAWAGEWKSNRYQACVRTVAEQWSPALDGPARACFEERRWSFEDLLSIFEAPDAEVVRRAIQAAADLEGTASCLDSRVLERLPEPPHDEASRQEAAAIRRELGRIGTLQLAAFDDGGSNAAKALRERAHALDWAPLQSAVDLVVGSVAHERGDFVEAEASLVSAYFTAVNAGAEQVALEAATRLTSLVGDRLARPQEGKLWARHAETLLARAPAAELKSARLWEARSGTHFAQGELDEAYDLIAQAKEVYERILGTEHPRVGTVLDKIGGIQSARESLDDARQLKEKALSLLKTTLGPRHPEVARVMSNLGIVHAKLGRLDQAQGLFEEALAIDLDTYGELHPSTGSTLLNLGNVAAGRGQPDQARAYFERALAAQEHAFGSEHPKVAHVLNALGNLDADRGPEALALYERALRITEKALGPDSPDVVRYLGNMAQCHLAAGDFEEAEALTRRALELREKAFGKEHVDVGRALRDLAEIEEARGALEEATRLHDQAISILSKTLGPEHREIALIMHNNAAILFNRGLYDESRQLFERAREMFERTAGSEHPQAARNLSSLASLELHEGAIDRAQDLYAQALAIQEKLFGDAPDPDLATTLLGLGFVHLERQEPKRAVAYLERAHAMREATKAPNALLGEVRFALARALWESQEDRQRALTLARRAADDFRAAGDDELTEVVAWLRKHRT